MFSLFRTLLQRENLKNPTYNIKNLFDTDFDDIWNIDNKNNFLIALNGWLCKKSNYGKSIDMLSDAEKAFFFVFQFEAEVNNGGFSQFLYNDSGSFAN